ncbi:hypothetical protein Syun_014133 [Stephania yunnanensis]|uniref:Uncharacterized protein n=1 Tax=Stephania yunnanensis TaxID=152371 RepID=A0AAP0JIQ3_9MAGN
MEIGEAFDEFWDMYLRLILLCPMHGFIEKTLMPYFYEGLNHLERRFLDTICEGS